jgi:hypothetical protein
MGPVPVPVSESVCGLPVASSVTVIAPVRFPFTLGEKVTLMAQFAPAVTLLPQVFVWAKSPLTATLVMASGPLPVFVRVSVLAGEVVPLATLPNAKLEGASCTVGAVPVPVRETDCVPPGALSIIVSVPGRLPPAVGVNVMLMMHFAPTATLEPHVLSCEKSPLMPTLEIARASLPELVSVTD